MPIWLFFGLSISYVLEYTKSSKTLFTELANYTRIMRFYQPNCEFSAQSERPFEKASHHFPKVLFWNIDCSKFSAVCSDHVVVGTPSLILETSGKRFVFTQERTKWNIINFIEEKSGYQIKSVIGTAIHPITNNTLFKTISTVRPRVHCKVSLYHAKWSRLSMRMWKDFRKFVAPAFQYDDIVKLYITEASTEQRSFSFIGASFPPIMFITNSRGTVNITSYSSGPSLVDTINAHCGTYRMSNGWLKPSVGASKQEGDLIRGLARGVLSPAINTSFYRRVFTALNSSGTSGVKAIVDKILGQMNRVTMSPKKHDELNRKINVLNMLIDYAETLTE